MEPADILKKAWEAVQAANLPESLQEVAFREAVEIVRDGPAGPGSSTSSARTASARKRTAAAKATKEEPEKVLDLPDENTFFAELASESGVAEKDLRDVLILTEDGKVQIQQPARTLGKNTAQQARTIVALVAGARSKGLGEKPVDADSVRKEVERKNAYQQNNFATGHLAAMKGFNAGSKPSEILLTSKWVDEFVAAVDQALGRKPPAT